MWRQEVEQHDVLVLTYQILLNTLSAGFIQACSPLLSATAYSSATLISGLYGLSCCSPQSIRCWLQPGLQALLVAGMLAQATAAAGSSKKPTT